MAINYKLDGMSKLQKELMQRVSKDKVVSVVKRNTTQMQQTAMSKASSVYTKRDKHGKPYSTGDTKKSIGVSFENSGMSGITGMGQNYNPFTEKGTRFMAAEPLLKPTFNSQKTKFESDLEKLLK